MTDRAGRPPASHSRFTPTRIASSSDSVPGGDRVAVESFQEIRPMPAAFADIDQLPRSETLAEAEEARVELEYHALMGVLGGDIPTHVRAFDRDVFGPVARPARGRK